jgi:hypothetical protein
MVGGGNARVTVARLAFENFVSTVGNYETPRSASFGHLLFLISLCQLLFLQVIIA